MSAWGAFIGLLVSIFLIIRKVSPVYSLILGALVGGLLGGVSLPETVSLMISGVNDVTPAVIRILTAGVLSGILVKTGAAASISNTIIYRLGERHVFFALAFATMLLTAIGVFIDVAVITVAPQAALPSFASSMVAPVVTILLLSFRPLFHVAIDPMIALPVGGIVGILAMRKWLLITDSLYYSWSDSCLFVIRGYYYRRRCQWRLGSRYD